MGSWAPPAASFCLGHSPSRTSVPQQAPPPPHAYKPQCSRAPGRRTPARLPMSRSPPAPVRVPEPAPPGAPSLSAGGDDNDDHDDFSPLLDLHQRFPDLFQTYVLERLDPTARASLTRTGSAFWDLVFPRSNFLGSAERLGWAKANGCPWVARTLTKRRSGWAPGSAAVGAAAWLPVEHA